MDTSRCPKCKTPIDWSKNPIECPACGKNFADLISERLKELREIEKMAKDKKKADEAIPKIKIGPEIALSIWQDFALEATKRNMTKRDGLEEALREWISKGKSKRS